MTWVLTSGLDLFGAVLQHIAIFFINRSQLKNTKCFSKINDPKLQKNEQSCKLYSRKNYPFLVPGLPHPHVALTLSRSAWHTPPLDRRSSPLPYTLHAPSLASDVDAYVYVRVFPLIYLYV